jgi:hypothetical protein
LRRGARRARPLLPALALSLLLAPAAGRGEGEVSFRGYVKNFAILLAPPAPLWEGEKVDEPDLGAVMTRLRLGLTLRPSGRVSFTCEYDVSPRLQSARLFSEAAFPAGLGPAGYRLVDLRDRILPGPNETPANFAVYQNLDRFAVTIRTRAADIIVGRQAVAWGSARVVNPTDILAPFAFNELDKEERTGVDAVRVRVPLGPMDELDIGAVAGERFRAGTGAFYLRGKTRALDTDVSAVAMAFRRHLLLGVDLARSVGGAGAWLEAAYVIPAAFSGSEAEEEKDYFRASAGLDYNFGPKTYGFVEYHFSSAGGQEPGSYLGLAGTTPYREGAVYLLGRHYLSVGGTYQITPLLPFTGLVIANIGDLSLVLAPSLEFNLSQNVYLAGGAYLGLGKRPEFLAPPPGPGAPPDLLRSEFGSYPDMIYASFRVYF